VAGATHHFSKEAEIKTKFEVVCCLKCSCFIVCLYLITEILSPADYLSAVLLMLILLSTVKLSNKKNGQGYPPFPYCVRDLM
jgi:hypothetical protein